MDIAHNRIGFTLPMNFGDTMSGRERNLSYYRLEFY